MSTAGKGLEGRLLRQLGLAGVGVGWLEWGPALLAQGGVGVPESRAGRAGTIRVPGTREAVTTACGALIPGSPSRGQRRLPTTSLVWPGWHPAPSSLAASSVDASQAPFPKLPRETISKQAALNIQV